MLGITSIVFSWWGLLTLLQVVLAITFGAVGISKANHGARNRGLAVAGLVLGLIGLVTYFFIGLFSLGTDCCWRTCGSSWRWRCRSSRWLRG